MAVYSNEEINEVRIKSDIVEVIGEHVPLVKKGKNYFGVCPFHDDHNPSMSVSPEKQIYRCFVCGASGNVFSFLMDYDNISFPEAIQTLADKNGISLSKTNNFKNTAVNSKSIEAYNLSSKLYINNLNTPKGKKALEYLHNRGIAKDIIEEFDIGLSVDDSFALTKFLKTKNMNYEELVNIGLINNTENDYYDVFKNRIMFPLWNPQGNVVGYSGRIYTDSDAAKYMNTRETKIFKKGELLYNYHRAKNHARKKKEIILVEGFMDVIRLYSIGVKNVVALMGTALTKTQISLLKKLSQNIIICLDGDDAGDKATSNIANDLKEASLEPKIVRLDEKLDPDEYIIKYGKEKMIGKLENPMTFLEHKIKFVKKGKDLSKPEDVSKYIEELGIFLGDIEDDIVRELLVKDIALELDISKELIANKIKKKEKSKVKQPEIIETKKRLNKYLKAERTLLYYMLRSDEVSSIYENRISYLPSLEVRVLANEIIDYRVKNDELNIADFLTFINKNESLVKLLGEIESMDIEEEIDMEEIEELIEVLSDFIRSNEVKRLKLKMKEEPDLSIQAEIAEKIRKMMEEN